METSKSGLEARKKLTVRGKEVVSSYRTTYKGAFHANPDHFRSSMEFRQRTEQKKAQEAKLRELNFSTRPIPYQSGYQRDYKKIGDDPFVDRYLLELTTSLTRVPATVKDFSKTATTVGL